MCRRMDARDWYLEKRTSEKSSFHVLEDVELEEEVNNLQPRVVKTRVALDSGATDQTASPSEIPNGAEFVANETGRHFVGAGGDVITKHGAATTTMTGTRGGAQIQWQVADVTRVLQSVSKTCGPEGGPVKYDVLFTN